MVKSSISFTGTGSIKRQREVHMCGVYENVITYVIETDQFILFMFLSQRSDYKESPWP